MSSWSKNQPENILSLLNHKIWMHWFLCVDLPCSTDISASAELFPAGIRVSWPPEYTWLTDKAEIAPQHEPEKSISNEAILNALESWISLLIQTLSYPWSTVRAEIARAEMVWATLHKLCRKVACQWSRMLTWFQLFCISLFFLLPYFTCYDSDPVRIWSHLSRSCTVGYPGCTQMHCPLMSHMGTWNNYFIVPNLWYHMFDVI